jgi:kynurenine formamidase
MTIGPALAAGLLLCVPAAVKSDVDVDALIPRLSNWNRWGAADERGTLNFIGPEQVVAARALVRDGVIVSLAREVKLAGNAGVPRAQYEMLAGGGASRDYLGAVWHGFAQTHMDALCHVFANDRQMYNGHPTSAVGPEGCAKLGIGIVARSGIVARGVLVDLPASTGAPLEPGHAIRIAELEAALRRQSVEVRRGDVLLVRTGAGPRNTRERRAGLHPECLAWVRDKEIALLGSDGDSDVAPLPGFTRWASAFHAVAIPHLGLPLMDNVELDEVAATAHRLRRYEFMVVVAPWRMSGATSSPVNPIAVF